MLVHLWWWFQYVTGTTNVSGRPYGFFSGFGSDLSEFAILWGIFLAYRKINCHVEGCPRIGHFELHGTPYKLCKKHSPNVPEHITHLHVLKKFKENNHGKVKRSK